MLDANISMTGVFWRIRSNWRAYLELCHRNLDKHINTMHIIKPDRLISNSTMEKCTHMQEMKQPVRGRALNTEERNWFSPARIYLLKVNNRNTRTSCKIWSKLTIKTPEPRRWRQWRQSDVFIVNFEHIWHLTLVFLLLTLNM